MESLPVMSFRKIAIRSASSFPGIALAGLLAAGLTARPVCAATTTYDTNNTPYTGGTIVAGDTVLLNDGATVTGNVTDDGVLQFNQTSGLTIANNITGSGTVSLTNSGTLTLSGNNGLTGLSQINGGVLALGSGNALAGSGSISFGGGALQYSVSNTADYSSRIQNSGSGIAIDTNGQSVTFATALASSNTGGLTKQGIGTLTLSGNSAYTGVTRVTSGTLQVGAGSTTGSITGDVVNNAALVFNRSNALTYAGAISGTGALTKLGASITTLTGSSSYTGGTTITSGTLRLGTGNSGGTTGAIVGDVVVGNNAALQFNRSDALTYSGATSGAGGLQKAGDGQVTLSGSNSFGGATVVAGGTLALGNANALAGSGSISFRSISGLSPSAVGTLQYSSSNTVDYSSRFQGSNRRIAIDTNGQDVTFASTIAATNSQGIGKYGLGTLTISGSNSFGSFWTFAGGTVALANANALGLMQVGNRSFQFSGGTLRYSSSNTADISDAIVASAAAIAIDTNGQDVLFASNLAGNNGGGLNKLGLGTLTLSGNNDYAGSTTVNGGVLALGNAGALGRSGTIVFGGGVMRYSASNTVDYSSKILNSGSAIAIDTNGQSVTFATGLATSNIGGLTKSGSGTLTFSGANSYSGLTTIAGGTVALSGTGSIGTGGLNLGTTGSPGVFELSALTAGSYSLPSSASLAGVGTISGNGKSLAVLGAFTPGNSPGTVTLGSGFTLDLSSSGTSVFEITSPAYTAGTYDLVSGSGSVVFGGILNLAFSGGTYTDGTDVLQIFANTGSRSGNFSAVNVTGLATGQSATFNPVTGFITVVPEPSTCASLLAGLACGGYSMFRRRRVR